MDKHDESCCRICYGYPGAPTLTQLAQECAEKISKGGGMETRDKVAELVIGVVAFTKENPYSNGEAYIREVLKAIEELFPEMDNPAAWVVAQLLRRVQMYALTNDSDHNVELAINKIMLLEGTPVPASPGLQKIYKNIMEMFEKTGGLFTNASLAAEYSHKIAEELNMEEWDGEFVPQYYEMDPETEDVLANANMVLEDMVVLVEDPACRQEIHEGLQAHEVSRARMWNRWSTVTFPEIRTSERGTDIFSFVAVYDDGTKRKISCGASVGWIVKLDSVPRIDEIFQQFDGEISVLYTSPTKKVVRALVDMLGSGRSIDKLSVKVGEDGDFVSAHEYLIAEGAIPGPPEDIYEIIDQHGNIEYSGSAEDVVLMLVRSTKKSRANNHVAKTDSEEARSALEFLKDHGVRIEGESFQRDIVLNGDDQVQCSGEREKVREFLRGLDPEELNQLQLKVKVYECDDTITVGQYFNLDELKLEPVYNVIDTLTSSETVVFTGGMREILTWMNGYTKEALRDFLVENVSTGARKNASGYFNDNVGDADA